MTDTRRTPQHGAAALVSLLLLLGCGNDDGDEETREPPPPELTILAVQANGAARWQAGDPPTLDLGCPPSRALVVQLGEPAANDDRRSLENWLLRAPGACGTRERCGYVNFELSAASTAVYRTDIALSEFGIAAADVTSPPGLGAGVYTLRAELRRDDGSVFLLRGAPITAALELTFTTPAACAIDPGGDAGSDGG